MRTMSAFNSTSHEPMIAHIEHTAVITMALVKAEDTAAPKHPVSDY